MLADAAATLATRGVGSIAGAWANAWEGEVDDSSLERGTCCVGPNAAPPAEEDDEVIHRDGDDSGATRQYDEDERQAQRAALARRTRNEHAALRRRFMR